MAADLRLQLDLFGAIGARFHAFLRGLGHELPTPFFGTFSTRLSEALGAFSFAGGNLGPDRLGFAVPMQSIKRDITCFSDALQVGPSNCVGGIPKHVPIDTDRIEVFSPAK